MQVTETLSEGLKRGFNVVLPAADIEAKRAKRLAEVAKTVSLPGFRPGKVPMTVVKKRYEGAITAEILEESVNAAATQVLTDRNLRTASQPQIEIVSLADGQDVVFSINAELLPDITMPDFAAITLTRLKAEPSDESIDKTLAEISKRQQTFTTLEGDDVVPAEIGHTLTVSYVGKIDGVAFEGGTGNDADIELGGTGYIPGFAEGMVGMKPGDERQINVTFPENYGSKELAGKAATFDITAKALKKAQPVEINDEFASTMGFDSVEDLRKAIASSMQREYDQASRLRLKRELLDALAGMVTFDAPDSMVESEFSQIWQRIEQDRASGQVDDEDAGKDERSARGDEGAEQEYLHHRPGGQKLHPAKNAAQMRRRLAQAHHDQHVNRRQQLDQRGADGGGQHDDGQWPGAGGV